MNAYKAYHEALAAQKRIPEAEQAIMEYAMYAYLYARDIIKGRWLDSESTILKNTECAYFYTRDVIKDRWLEAEEIIAKSRWKDEYLKQFFNEPVVTKDEISDDWWKRHGFIGYFAPASWFKESASLLDVMVKE